MGADNAECVRSTPDVTGDGRDEVLVGIGKSGDIRCPGPGAGGDDRFRKADCLAADFEGARTGEGCVTEKDIDAHLCVAFGGVVGCNSCA